MAQTIGDWRVRRRRRRTRPGRSRQKLLSLDDSAFAPGNAELVEQVLAFGPTETHRQQNQVGFEG